MPNKLKVNASGLGIVEVVDAGTVTIQISGNFKEDQLQKILMALYGDNARAVVAKAKFRSSHLDNGETAVSHTTRVCCLPDNTWQWCDVPEVEIPGDQIICYDGGDGCPA